MPDLNQWREQPPKLNVSIEQCGTVTIPSNSPITKEELDRVELEYRTMQQARRPFPNPFKEPQPKPAPKPAPQFVETEHKRKFDFDL